jgi:hypothetical protein
VVQVPHRRLDVGVLMASDRLLDAAVDTIPELVLRELEPSYLMSDTARR